MAKTSMKSSPTTLSDRDVSAARFVGDVRDEVLLAYLDELYARDLKKSDIARLLEIDRSAVTRMLNGTGPIELKTLGKLAWALGRKPKFQMQRKQKTPFGSNSPMQSNSVANVDAITASEMP